MNSSFLTVITTIAEVGALGGLLWQLILSRRESKARFMVDVYNDQEEKLNLILDDDSRLGMYARKRGITRKQAKDRIMATIDINDAAKNYLIQKSRLIGNESGDRLLVDIKNSFSYPEIQQRWESTKHYYPRDFQDFIDLKSIQINSK